MKKCVAKTSLILSVMLASLFVSSKRSLAHWNCDTNYGGHDCHREGELIIDKTVLNPDTGTYVNSLYFNDPKFAPGTEVKFRLEVKNIGHGAIEHVKVRDDFPDYIQFNWFELGSSYWDANKREINFEIDKLDPGQSKTYVISMHVYPKKMLPNDKDLICETNLAFVGTDINNPKDSDNSQFCITHKVLGIKSLPATGMPGGIELAVGLMILSLVGTRLALIKK